jgi:hypothetical protein
VSQVEARQTTVQNGSIGKVNGEIVAVALINDDIGATAATHKVTLSSNVRVLVDMACRGRVWGYRRCAA